MAISWPDTLPAPQRSGLSIKPNVDVLVKTLQSGRKEVRRFGTSNFDILTCTLRLIGPDQLAAFHQWYDRETNFGLNWISADWLGLLGYSGYYCRILGYSPRQSIGTFYTDYSITFLIRENADDDTYWPDEGPGGGEDPVVIVPQEPFVCFCWAATAPDENLLPNAVVTVQLPDPPTKTSSVDYSG